MSILPASLSLSAAQPVQPTALVPTSSASSSTFGDVLDALNPLQHIPIVSSLYRAATGSQISSASQVAGDTLYGALLPGGAVAGLASSLADVAVKKLTGASIAQNALNIVTPSASAAAPAPVASALVPAVSSAATAPAISAIPAALARHPAHSAGSQYERTQTLDAVVNRQLVKMAV